MLFPCNNGVTDESFQPPLVSFLKKIEFKVFYS